MYIELEEIKKHLNVDLEFNEDDAYIMQLVNVAEQAVERNADIKFSDLIDKYGSLPKPLIQAMKLLVGNLYANRESIAFTSVNELPLSYTYLINLYKDW